MCSDQPQFLVLKGVVATSGTPAESIEQAMQLASEKTRSDRDPRIVVRVMAQVATDPQPTLVVTRFDEGERDE